MRPSQANVEYAPNVIANARNNQINDAAFDDTIAADRARTRRPDEVGGANPGTPGGAVFGADPYKRIRQAGTNAFFGR
jgi:hypothetical protein